MEHLILNSHYFFIFIFQGKADVKASKAFSWLLRHGAEKEGLVVYPGGWVILDDILRKPNFKKVIFFIISKFLSTQH